MKKQSILILIWVVTLFLGQAQAQTLNWASLKEDQKNIINANAGLEHGAVFGLGYGRQFKTPLFPLVAHIEYSVPSGNSLFDDSKTKIGGQVRLLKYSNIQVSTRIQGVFRTYENDFVRLSNFGSDMAGTVGYYRPKWFTAAEVGFDKAIVTHFNHTDIYRSQFDGVKDGWYEPSTGGNFYYGLQAGYSLGRHDLYVKAGKMLNQDFKTTPLLPFYGQLGYNIRF